MPVKEIRGLIEAEDLQKMNQIIGRFCASIVDMSEALRELVAATNKATKAINALPTINGEDDVRE